MSKNDTFTKHKRRREEKVKTSLNKLQNNYNHDKIDNKQNSRKVLDKILDDTERIMATDVVVPNISTEHKLVDTKALEQPKLVSLGRYTMDEEGRLIDAMGNVISLPTQKSTLMINKNKEKEQRVKEMLKTQKIDMKEAKKRDIQYFDHSLEKTRKKRERIKQNAFKFTEEGTYEKRMEILKLKNAAKQLGLDLHTTMLTEEEEKDLLKPEIVHRHDSRQPLKLTAIDLVPDIEWWDIELLPSDKKCFSPYWIKDEKGNFIHKPPSEIDHNDFKVNEKDFNLNKIDIYIHHPVPIKNDYFEKMNKINMPVFLTKKEKKRIHKIRRSEKEKEKQEKIKLGLMKPPEPKLKFNNFMNILADAAVQDPSQIQKVVKKAYEKRYAKMMKENESRKLTKQQKSEKVKRKWDRDSKKELKACLFKIEDLTDKRNRFKVNWNSEQLYLTGQCLISKKNLLTKYPSMIYVEGGALAIKKYKNLLLRRIRWDKSKPIEDEEMSDTVNQTEYKINPKCLLVWEGTIKKRLYDKWRLNTFRSETDAKKKLSEKNLEHYWNLILSFKHEYLE
jgi:U4/U6 small nuclear ribonucleoprotein PRP3